MGHIGLRINESLQGKLWMKGFSVKEFNRLLSECDSTKAKSCTRFFIDNHLFSPLKDMDNAQLDVKNRNGCSFD